MRPRRTLPVLALALAAPLALGGCGLLGGEEADLQVYSARHYDLEKAFEEFTDETGITVEFLYGVDGHEDVGMLWNAGEQGVLAPIDSPALDEAVPADLRDPDGRWYGLAARARTIVYNPDAVDPSEFDAEDSYAGLDDPRWAGRLCMRGETEAYTQSLVASLIDLHGREKAQEIVDGWVANDVEIYSNDVEMLEAIDAGGCDVGISNHYYLARELEEKPDFNVSLYWASQEGAGTHVNISGAGVVANSDNPEQARQLIEWLATTGQNSFVDGNHEFPVNPEVKPEPMIAEFGEFKRMPLNAAAYGQLNAQAIELLAEAGYK